MSLEIWIDNKKFISAHKFFISNTYYYRILFFFEYIILFTLNNIMNKYDLFFILRNKHYFKYFFRCKDILSLPISYYFLFDFPNYILITEKINYLFEYSYYFLLKYLNCFLAM